MSQTNAEYGIDNHQGHWAKSMNKKKCCGWFLQGSDCQRTIGAGENYLKTGLSDYDGTPIVLCAQCAEKSA